MGKEKGDGPVPAFLNRRNTSQGDRSKSVISMPVDSLGIPVDLISPTSDRMKHSFIITNGATKNMELFRKAQASRKTIILKDPSELD